MAQVRLPNMPYGSYVADEAGILSTDVRNEVNQMALAVDSHTGVPIYVVTIRSLKDMNAGNMSIEGYAAQLFNTWQIGTERDNRGVLILVSPNDRVARIELGGDWGRTKDEYCQQIMNDWMVPRFKKGDYGGGVLAGVRSADTLIRSGRPSRPFASVFNSRWMPFAGMAVLIIVLFLAKCYWDRPWERGSYYYDRDNYYSGSSCDSGSSDSGGGGGSSGGGGGATGSW